MGYLIASLVALFCGPLLDRPSAARWAPGACIDGFIYVSVTGLIIGHILPESIEKAGWIALCFALLGVLGPRILETTFQRAVEKTHAAAQALAAIGLIAHAMVDGAILATVPTTGAAIGLAVILHRIPGALALWWLIRRSHDSRMAAIILTAMGVATVVGYATASSLTALLPATAAGLLEALVAGSLLHVILHRVSDENETRQGIKEGIGALLGVAMLLFVFPSLEAMHASGGHSHHDHGEELSVAHDHGSSVFSGFGDEFLEILLTTAPALVFAFFFAGIIQVFLPKFSSGWLDRGGHASRAVRGVAFGLPLPICSCGVVPVYHSLIERGVAPTAALAFLVATPELGLDAILVSLPLLGADFTAIRVIAAAAVAVTVGVLVGARIPRAGMTNEQVDVEAAESFTERLKRAFRTGATEIFDSTGPWVLFGIALAALCAPALSRDFLAGVPEALQVPLFALIGMPVYVCASGATPLVAVLVAKGVSPGAALAFLLTGPATNITTFGLLNRLHGRRAAIAFMATMTVTTITLALAVDMFMEPQFTGTASGEHVHQGGASWQIVAAWMLAGLLAASILRRGPRAFVGEVVGWAGGHDHHHGEHEHGHHDHHDDHGDDDGSGSSGGSPPEAPKPCCH